MCPPPNDGPAWANDEEIPMKRLMTAVLLATFAMSTLTACNTMAGAGKDVQKVGEKVEDKAQDCKDGRC